MRDLRRAAVRREADRAAGERWLALHDPAIAELGRIAAAVSATMAADPLAWASLPAEPGGRATPEQLRAVREGLLPRSFARSHPGTVGARAIRRVEYLDRRAAHPELTARQALGHRPAPPPAAMSAILRGRGFVIVEAPSRSERSRIARYDSLIGQLRWNELDPRAFQRRVRRWRTLRGEHFEDNPAVVLAILATRAEAGETLFIYEGRQP